MLTLPSSIAIRFAEKEMELWSSTHGNYLRIHHLRFSISSADHFLFLPVSIIVSLNPSFPQLPHCSALALQQPFLSIATTNITSSPVDATINQIIPPFPLFSSSSLFLFFQFANCCNAILSLFFVYLHEFKFPMPMFLFFTPSRIVPVFLHIFFFFSIQCCPTLSEMFEQCVF